MTDARNTDYVLLTGGTGFIGHNLLAELLRTDHRCVVLVRPPHDKSIRRLVELLRPFDLDVDDLIASERILPLVGDICVGLEMDRSIPVKRVIHVAASTRFESDGSGEPSRTNLDGTRHVLEWASRHAVRDFHLVSSAYVCGKVSKPVIEEDHHASREFHNEYELSKWTAEGLCRLWSLRDQRRLTIYRPSVVVGEYATGRCTKFSGFYLSARATSLLSRSLEDADAESRRHVSLRIKGRPDDCQNIVPIDYVVSAIAAIMCDESAHGSVYHLTHPDPPTNQQIKSAFEQYYRIGGGCFVAPEEFGNHDLNEWESSFYEISKPIEHYLVDTPTFGRANMDSIDRAAGLRCPAYDTLALIRLLRYAESVEWGRQRVSVRSRDQACAHYFESYLPTHVSKSRVSQMTSLTTNIRFVIDDELNGEWACRFIKGKLESVHRGCNGVKEDFGYRTTRDVFWSAISGQVHPQELFLTGKAEVFGNVEQALKMAMILYDFNREFPCDRPMLAKYSGDAHE